MTEPNPAPSEKANRTSLPDFIAQNEKVLTAIGVFVALSAFVISLPFKSLATMLAFVSLVATFPLIYEILKRLINANRSLNLTIFSNVFFLFFLKFVWYILIAFRDQWKQELHKVVFWLIFLSLLALYSRYLQIYFERLYRLFNVPIFYLESAGDKAIHFMVDAVFTLRETINRWKETKGLSWVAKSRRKILDRRRWQRVEQELAAQYQEKRQKDWDAMQTSVLISTICAVILSIVGFIGVGLLENPIADFINTALDIEAEEYQHEEQRPHSNDLDPNAVPAPVESPSDAPV